MTKKLSKRKAILAGIVGAIIGIWLATPIPEVSLFVSFLFSYFLGWNLGVEDPLVMILIFVVTMIIVSTIFYRYDITGRIKRKILRR